MGDERRRARSAEPARAAALYMESVRRRCLVDALLVADDRGHIVAASGDQTSIDALAEVGRRAIAGDADAGLEGVDVFAHRLTVPGQPLLLVSSGNRVDRVRRVEADLARIFA